MITALYILGGLIAIIFMNMYSFTAGQNTGYRKGYAEGTIHEHRHQNQAQKRRNVTTYRESQLN